MQVPHLYFITTGDGGAINGIDVTPLRDFIGLEGCDDSVKQALLDFGCVPLCWFAAPPRPAPRPVLGVVVWVSPVRRFRVTPLLCEMLRVGVGVDTVFAVVAAAHARPPPLTQFWVTPCSRLYPPVFR
jgi:hypothetical protein